MTDRGIVSEQDIRHDDVTPKAMLEGELVAARSPDAIVAIDETARVVFANPHAERLFGYGVDEILGRVVDDLVPERDRTRRRASLRQAHHHASPSRAAWTDFTGLHRSGRELALELSVSSCVNDDCRIAIWFIRDVRARQRAEHVAAERSALLAQIADGVVIADPNGHITFVNESARRLLGARSVDKAGRRFALDARFATTDGTPCPTDQFPLTRTVQTGMTIVDFELLATRPDGSAAIVQASSTPIVAGDGARLGSVATFRDVTEQRQFEIGKSEFIGAVSHELRTPITVIQGQAQFLARKLESGNPAPLDVRARLEKISLTAKMMTGLVNRLIDATRSRLGQTIPLSPRLPAEASGPAPQVEAISEVARALVQETALDRVAWIVADHVLRLFNAAAAAVWLVDSQRDELRPLAMRSVAVIDSETRSQLQAFPLDNTTMVGKAALREQPVEISDVAALSEDMTLARRIFERVGYRGGCAQPLITRGRLVGVLSVLYAAPHAFVAQERALIQALGDFCAVAIDNARVYRELEDAVNRKTESLAQLDALVESAPIGFASLDQELRFRQVNRTLASLGHAPAEEYLGRTIRESFPWLAEVAEPILRRVLTSEQATIDVEVSGDNTPGPTAGRSWLAHFYPICLPGGELHSAGLVLVEITRRKEVEKERDRHLEDEQKARREAESLAAQRAAILSHIADGVVLVDAAGHVTFQNNPARQMVGDIPLGIDLPNYTAAIRLETSDGQPYGPRDLLLLRALRNKETSIRVEQHARVPGKPPVILESSAAPVVGDDGTQLGAVLTLRDVTTQRALEQERDALYSAATHDLKNPLTVILGRAERLDRQARDPNYSCLRQLVPTFEVMASTAKRTVSLVDELLDVTRARLGRALELNRRPMDLVALLRDAINEYQMSDDQPRIRLVASVDAVIGCWDATRLERLFGNLLSNAVKYSPVGGEIVVDVTVVGKSTDYWAMVKVRDRGMGIPAGDLPYIFEPFKRATNVGARIAGSGIGLTSARYLTEQHGGVITVDSEEGVGSTFIVRLPLRMASELAAA
jgi:PAS domain S-box-containing protein